MQIPQSDILTTNRLGKIFLNTVATYKFYVVLNQVWDAYLHTHYNILMDFAYWNLTLFLQTRNPNVPAIPNKLIRPEVRNSLTKQRNYWDMVMAIGGPIHCIYTDKLLYPKDYDLDHFIPWSFVCHDLLWNLIPSNGSINSSKSDKLPDLDSYLPKFAALQHHSLQVLVNAEKEPKVMEDFLSLGYSAKDLAAMSEEKFREIYERTPKGTAYFAVRRDLEEEGFRLHAIHKQYTYQCNVKLPYKSLVANKSYELYQYNHFNKLPRKEGETCPFCKLSRRVEIICETATCVAFYDGYPVSPGHALIIPKRHVANYFDLTNHEREAMNVVLQYVKQKVDERFHPDGYGYQHQRGRRPVGVSLPHAPDSKI